jgi:hypothetical protein
MKECAFCNHTGKLSAEHITSEWMKALFPGKGLAKYIDGETNEPTQFSTRSVDWKAKVVCEKCNTTWMNDIENEHAKPALTPLITGEVNVPIDLCRAKSIALFAFKTAVILDHAHPRGTPFFSKRIRHAFRLHHEIPYGIAMWFCGYRDHRKSVKLKTVHHKAQFSPTEHFLMYVCTCAFGYFAFQVVMVKQAGEIHL